MKLRSPSAAGVTSDSVASVSSLLSLLALLVLAPIACSGGAGAVTTDSGAASTSWTNVYGEVLTQCADHHSGGASAAGNLDMGTQSSAYANLVGVPAQGPACGIEGLDGGTPLVRVLPGDSAKSLLYQKLAGTQTCGSAMPDESSPLPASQIALVKSWIDEGAPNN
jgi:hypothetical protein